MKTNRTVAALAVVVALPFAMAAKCERSTKHTGGDATQGTVTAVTFGETNDTTYVRVQLDAEHGGGVYIDAQVTSKHDWDYCNVRTTWPKCLKSWAG
jgi:hypothetical protein